MKKMKKVIALLISVIVLATSVGMDILAVEVAENVKESIAKNEESRSLQQNDSVEDTKNVTVLSEESTEAEEEEKENPDTEVTDGITRVEWLKKLTTLFEMTSEEENYPEHYFSDLDPSSEYYQDVMLAVEYGILKVEAGQEVDPEGLITRDFAVDTLNYCLGIQNESTEYTFSDSASCTNPDNAQVAVNRGWLVLLDGKFVPDQILTKEEAEVMLNDASVILDESVVEDGSSNEYTFADHVIVFDQFTEIQIDENDTVTIIEPDKSLNKGETFVVWPSEIPAFYVADNIASEENKMVVTTTEADVSTALLDVNAEGFIDVDLEDFEGAEGFEVEYIKTDEQVACSYQTYGITATKNSVVATKIFEIADGIEVSFTCNLTNLKFHHKNKDMTSLSATITGNYQVISSASFDAIAAANGSSNIIIGTATVAGVGKVTVSIELALNGEISYTYNGNFKVGLQKLSSGEVILINNFKKTGFYSDIQAQAKLGLKVNFGINIYFASGDIYASTGVDSKFTSHTYNDGEAPNRCSALSAWWYTKVGYSAKLGVGKLSKSYADSMYIFDAKNSPVQLYFHWEDGVRVYSCNRGSYGYYTSIDSKYGNSSYGGGNSTGMGSNGEIYTLYTYSLDQDNNATITGYNGNASALYIPNTLDGYTVVGIGANVFKGNTKLLSVSIPDTVTSIGNHAFYGTAISLIELPNSITSMGDYVFAHTKLEALTLPSNLTTMGAYILEGTEGVKEITIPKYVTTMRGNQGGYQGSLKDSSIEKVVFEEGITVIPTQALHCTYQLKEVILPNTVVKIETDAFAYAGLSELKIPDSVINISKNAFSNSSLNNIVWNKTMTTIPEGLFSGCTKLKSFDFTNIKSIGASAFYNCDTLTELNIPESVISIGASAFYNCDSLTELNVPESVTSIGASAFYNCDNLSKVTIGNGVTSIGASAFYNNDALTDVNLGTNVSSLGNSIFQDCDALEQIVIPNSVTSLGTSAFYDCDLLTDVTLGNCLTSLPASTFEHCDVLETIVLPYRIASIGAKAFKDSVKFANITIPRATTTIDSTAFSYPAQMTIYGVAGTYAETFANEKGIKFVNQEVKATEVTLNHKELTLNKGASAKLVMTVTPADFTDAVSWKSSDTAVATIAADGTVKAAGLGTATIKLIVGDVSTSCKVTVVQPVTSISLNKTSVSLDALGTYQLTATVKPDTANNKAIEWKSSDEKIATVDQNGLVTALTKGTATITVAALDGSGVTNKCTVTVTSSVVIASKPEELESEHNYPNNFSDYWMYTEEDAAYLDVTFDEKTDIEDGFDYLYIYDKAGTQIGRYTGTELAGQTIHVEGDTIKIRLVSDDSGTAWGFKVIKIKTDASEAIASGWSGDLIWELTKDGVLTFSGEGAMKNYEYKTEMPWYQYYDQIKSVVLSEGVIRIGAYAFYGAPNLETITIPDTVTTIGDYAFKNAPKINNVVLPSGLTSLGDSAFYACTSLTSIEIPVSLWTIKPYTFKNCTALTEVTINEGNLEKISDGAFYGTALTELVLPDCLDILDVYAFKGCSKLASITIGSGLTELREAVFYGTAITTINIPEGIKKIGPYAFKNCVKLETVEFPSTLISVGEAAFYACTGLTEVELPDAVTSIDNYAFRKCAAITTLTLSSELTTIGECSFYGCTGLTELVVPNKVTTIKPYAFKTCTGLTAVTLGDMVETIGEGAFNTCTGLKTIVFPASLTEIGDYSFSGSYNLWKLTFLGDAPDIGTGAFKGLNATAYYPADNATWTNEVMQSYGGTISWKVE